MDQQEQIRRAYFIEGKGIRQIAREGHHHRCTIRRALQDASPLAIRCANLGPGRC